MSYSLILQFCREERSIVICGDPGNLRNKSWSGWTEICLDKFCPHVDWVNRRANFILHLQANMEVADQNHQWFKFLLRHQGGRYTRLEHTIFTEQKFVKRDRHKNRIDAKLHTRKLPLEFQVESLLEVSSFVKRIQFSMVLMWKDVLVLTCILPYLLKIRIHHVMNFMMMKVATHLTVVVVELTSATRKF